MKRVVAVALAENQSEGLIFENCTGIAVDDVLPDYDANKAFREIDVELTGVELETEPLEAKLTQAEPAGSILHNNQYILLPNNNQYALIAENEEDNEDNNKSTRVEDERTGVDSNDNKSTEVNSEIIGVNEANDKSDDMALIGEAIAESEWNIAEGT